MNGWNKLNIMNKNTILILIALIFSNCLLFAEITQQIVLVNEGSRATSTSIKFDTGSEFEIRLQPNEAAIFSNEDFVKNNKIEVIFEIKKGRSIAKGECVIISLNNSKPDAAKVSTFMPIADIQNVISEYKIIFTAKNYLKSITSANVKYIK